MKPLLFMPAFAALLLTACGNNEPDKNDTIVNSPSATEVAPMPATAPSATDSNEALITLSAGDDMKFDLTEIKVKEGQTVRLTLRHTGKAPKTAMGHNFVLLAAGADKAGFAKEAMGAKDNDYIPPALSKEIIAHTRTIGGGETDTIEFKAPPKGTYGFLCSFPGHFPTMQGKFIVE